MRKLVPLFSFVVIFLSYSDSLSREWTSDDGKTVSADYVRQDETSVVLRLSANGKEVTVPKERLSGDDREHLAFLANAKSSRVIDMDTTGRAKSPWYYVAEANGLFTPPTAGGAKWVRDRGRSAETPPPVSFPVVVEDGVQRFVNPSTRERIVVFGTGEFELLERVFKLPFFDKLKVKEKRALMAILSAAKLEHGKTSRRAVKEVLESKEFQTSSDKDKERRLFAAVRTSSPDLNRNFELSSFQEVETNDRWKKESRYTAFQIEEPETAWTNEVRVKGVGRVTVHSLRENDTTGLEAIAKGLSALPPEMVEYLEVVSLHYKGEGFWWGGGSQIYYVAPRDLKFDGPLVYVMAHEVGHCIQAQKVKNSWDEALENGIAFPSAYGLTNQAEDFAEFASIVTRAWTKPQEMIEIEEVFPWRHEIYTRALGYSRASSKGASTR
ncbi:MAG: hypothetical protein AAGA58_20225 [Verrucomicrobiota bacterium]